MPMNDEKKEVITTESITAGQMLRDARTTGRRKREIATISKQLCIREEFLQALEDGNYAVLPEKVYILGFARNYAMELGLDPDVIVEKIKQELGIVSNEVPAEDITPTKVDIKKTKITFSERLGKVKDYNICKFATKNWMWLLGGFVALLILLGVVLLISSVGNSHSVAEAVVQTQIPEPKYNIAVRERFGTENREKAEVILQTTQESWVKIEDARGKTVFSRVLVPGDVYYVPAGTKTRGTFGNAGAIDVWVKGQLAPKIGASHVRKNSVSLAGDDLLKSNHESKDDKESKDEKSAKEAE